MNGAALTAAYATLKTGTVWKKWAPSNPGEVSALDTFVQALASGKNPITPTLATATGKGIAGMLHAAAGDATGSLVTTIPVYSGTITFVTKDDGENTQIFLDGRLAWTLGPTAVANIDTTKLANGQHTLQFVYIAADGTPHSHSHVATFQVRN